MCVLLVRPLSLLLAFGALSTSLPLFASSLLLNASIEHELHCRFCLHRVHSLLAEIVCIPAYLLTHMRALIRICTPDNMSLCHVLLVCVSLSVCVVVCVIVCVIVCGITEQ